jgi:hypothetical protein
MVRPDSRRLVEYTNPLTDTILIGCVFTGLNVASLVLTDAAEDCQEGELVHMRAAHDAFDEVSTDFRKHIWSKRNMQYNHFQWTRNCMVHSSHTLEPLNMVMGSRYYNFICNSNTSDDEVKDKIPVGVDLGGTENTNRCFGGKNGDWMDNLLEVCEVDYKEIDNTGQGATGSAARSALHFTVAFPVLVSALWLLLSL